MPAIAQPPAQTAYMARHGLQSVAASDAAGDGAAPGQVSIRERGISSNMRSPLARRMTEIKRMSQSRDSGIATAKSTAADSAEYQRAWSNPAEFDAGVAAVQQANEAQAAPAAASTEGKTS